MSELLDRPESEHPEAQHPDYQRKNAIDLAGDMLTELSETGDMDRQFYKGVIKIIDSLTTYDDSQPLEY